MKSLLIAIFLLVLAASGYSVGSDEFTIGCYTYMKAWDTNAAVNNELRTYMQNAGFNLAMWETNDSNTSYSSTLINELRASGIDSYLCDYYWSYDSSTGSTSGSGSHAVSTGNYWRFEAEYDNSGGINNTADKYFSKFSAPNRVGEVSNDTGRYTWKCNYDPSITPPRSGVALHGLKTRWKEYGPGLTNSIPSSNERVIGPDFRFAAWGNEAQTRQYLSTNKLYLRYCYKVDSAYSGTDPAFTFKCAFKRSSGWSFVPIKNVMSTSPAAESITYTYSDLNSNMLTTLELPGIPVGFRLITFEIDLTYLYDQGFISTGAYWFSYLYGIDPYVYWHGSNTVHLDYLDVYDTTYDTIRNQPATVQGWLAGRLYTDEKRHYTLDEPCPPQFDTMDRLNRYVFISDQAIATINWRDGLMKKGPESSASANYERFSSPLLYVEETDPAELLVDYYPLEPQFNWNIASNDVNYKTSVQWNLDWKLLKHYREFKYKTMNENIPLYVVPCTSGRWNTNIHRWDYYQYPTPEMAKCLQMLPLCYGVAGVIDYQLMNPWQNIPTPYAPEYDAEDDRATMQWHALLEVDNYNTVSYNIQPRALYHSIREANLKLNIYGPLTKQMTWIDAVTIGTAGLFQPDDVYSQSSSLLNGVAYLDSLKVCVTDPDEDDYQGYVQCGFFKDIDENPWYMLVNRRTNFVDNVNGSLMMSSVDEIDQGIGYSVASPQAVKYVLDESANNLFGTYVGLYDRYDNSIFVADNGKILIEVDAGDGRLLQMCSSLPASITGNSVVKNIAFLSGPITINPGVNVTIQAGTITRIMKDSSIYVDNGASLTIRGTLTADENVRIEVAPNGYLVFENATCYWGQGSKIEVNGGSLTINCGSMDKTDDSTTWAGIRVTGADLVTISDAIISNAFINHIFDSNLLMSNSRINVPGGSYGLLLKNSAPGLQTEIINTEPGWGFYGFSNQTSKGIWLNKMKNPVYISNVDFQNLYCGILKTENPYATDSVYDCRFVNCATGVSLLNNMNGTNIQQCSFANNQTGKQGTGIQLVASSPTISTCNFTNLYRGVLTEFSLISGLGLESSVTESNFYNCEMGIESRSSYHRLKANYFNRNNSGIVNHAGSNLNLSYDANNVMMNHNANIVFYDTMPYESTIQLFTGHNDFYHLTDNSTSLSAIDFSFDANYFDFPLTLDFKINASKNWFQDDQVTFNNQAYVDYVYVDIYDPTPSMPAPPPESDRLFIALGYESQELYELACATYQAIIDDQLEEEQTYVTSAIDGLYRCTMMIPNPAWELTDYFDTKALQYAIDDPTLSAILKEYLAKVFVLNKDFQAAVDLIQLRIDNPISEIDSLRSVLDLEIVLQLAAMEEDKRPLTTKYAQYQYPDIQVFNVMHSNNWDKYNRSLRQNDQETNSVIAPTPQIQSNYPNPFNPSTTIPFSIPETGRVRVSVYNIKGQKVKDLLNTEMTRGTHRLVWDGRDTNNRNVASGIYFIKLESGGKTSIRKAMLMK